MSHIDKAQNGHAWDKWLLAVHTVLQLPLPNAGWLYQMIRATTEKVLIVYQVPHKHDLSGWSQPWNMNIIIFTLESENWDLVVEGKQLISGRERIYIGSSLCCQSLNSCHMAVPPGMVLCSVITLNSPPRQASLKFWAGTDNATKQHNWSCSRKTMVLPSEQHISNLVFALDQSPYSPFLTC